MSEQSSPRTPAARVARGLGALVRRLRGERDRGAATVFVVGMVIVLFGATGLAIDGGRAINARSKALDTAEQAARAGASNIDLAVLRNTGRIVINQSAAYGAAQGYLTTAGYVPADYAINPAAGAVTVTVEFDSPTVMLSLLGVDTIPIAGTATAAPTTAIAAGAH